MNLTSLTDAFPDRPWPKRASLSSSKHVLDQRDPEKEGRTFPTPVHRTQAAHRTHKKDIDELTSSLPIDDGNENFAPLKISAVNEHFTPEPAYAPPGYRIDPYEAKFKKLIMLIDEANLGQETPGTQDMLLYVFTGMFFLYTFEMFINLGK